MGAKTRVMNLRISEEQRRMYERAAELEGISVSALVTRAADAEAEDVVRSRAALAVPGRIFDALIHALDAPAPLADSLERALEEPRFENR